MVVVLPDAKSDLDCFVLMNDDSLMEIRRSSYLVADGGLGGLDVQGSAPRHVGRRRT